jgi:hypothetical protein
MTGMGDQREILSTDERRLLTLLRAGSPRRRQMLVRELLESAVERYLPHRMLREFMPQMIAGTPLSGGGYDGQTPLGQVQCILDELGGMSWPVLASEDNDETFGTLAEQYSDRLLARHSSALSIRANDFIAFLREWRSNVWNACEQVRKGMATTKAESEQQAVAVPDRFEEWVAFALTLDGERIAEEMGYPKPGQHDVAFDLSNPLLTVFDLRLNLYEKLRFMARQGRLPGEETDDERRQIAAALDWLRQRIHSNGRFAPQTLIQSETKGAQ